MKPTVFHALYIIVNFDSYNDESYILFDNIID